MACSVELASDAVDDFATIHHFLVDRYVALGEGTEEAFDRADIRIDRIKTCLRDPDGAPRQGTLRNDIRPGMRHVTRDRAIIYFDIDDTRQVLRVLALFYGGQDHHRHMLKRALSL